MIVEVHVPDGLNTVEIMCRLLRGLLPNEPLRCYGPDVEPAPGWYGSGPRFLVRGQPVGRVLRVDVPESDVDALIEFLAEYGIYPR